MEAIRNRSQQIEARPGTWAYTVVGAGADDSKAVLEDFHQSQVPSHHKFKGIHGANSLEST